MHLIIITFFFHVCCDLRGFIFAFKFLDLLDISIDIQSKAADQLSSLHMLAVDDNGTIFCDLALLRVWLLAFSALLKLHFFYCTRNNLLNELVCLAVSHFIVVCLTVGRENHIAFLWAGSILNGVPASDSLPIFDDMMLGCSVLHMDQTSCGGDLLGIEELRLRLIIVLFLKSVEEIMSCILWTLDFFHFFPDLFNVKIHDLVLIFDVKACATVAWPLNMPWLIFSCLRSFLLLLLNIDEFYIVIGTSKVNLRN